MQRSALPDFRRPQQLAEEEFFVAGLDEAPEQTLKRGAVAFRGPIHRHSSGIFLRLLERRFQLYEIRVTGLQFNNICNSTHVLNSSSPFAER